MMLSSQGDITKAFVEPRIREITLELLKIIRETENDDLTTVMQKIVCSYTEQLIPVAVDMCNHLVETFAQVLEGSDNDEKAITAMGLLNTMETILTVMEDHVELHAQLEPVVLQAVHHIFTNSIMEFYEEAFSLTYDLTTTKISDNMWEMFKLIFQVFERDGQDYFVDMMPALHNYVTIDTEAFLTRGNGQREFPTMVFNMCKKMLLESDPGEDPECHAAKLLEVIILQCKDKYNIDDMIPSFIEVAFLRLSKEIKTSELRTMCTQIGKELLVKISELQSFSRFFEFFRHRSYVLQWHPIFHNVAKRFHTRSRRLPDQTLYWPMALRCRLLQWPPRPQTLCSRTLSTDRHHANFRSGLRGIRTQDFPLVSDVI